MSDRSMVLDFDPSEPRDWHGRWTTGGGDAAEGPSVEVSDRPQVIHVQTVEEAVPLILEGKTVELPDTEAVHTLLDRLAKIAKDAEAKGDKAPDYDLCRVTVKGGSLFCGESLGVARIDMPQLAGHNAEGKWIDAGNQFVQHLKDIGIPVSAEEVPASWLRASQRELNGPKVAGMMSNPSFDPKGERIFVSRDNYVVDGHHRWAAAVGRDAADSKLGDMSLNVHKIDAPISEVLQRANDFTRALGIAPRAAHAGFDPGQPRDRQGQWTDTGAEPPSSDTAGTPPDKPFSAVPLAKSDLAGSLNFPPGDKEALANFGVQVRASGKDFDEQIGEISGAIGQYRSESKEIGIVKYSRAQQVGILAHEVGHAFDHMKSVGGDWFSSGRDFYNSMWADLRAARASGNEVAALYREATGSAPEAEVFADLYATQRLGYPTARAGMFTSSELGEVFPRASKVVRGIKVAAPAAQQSTIIDFAGFDPSQPRDQSGKWTDAGGGFVSPNVDEGLHVKDAITRLSGDRQQYLHNISRRINAGLGIKATEQDGIGAWSDGAEPTALVTMKGKADWDTVETAMAMRGLLLDQKAVVVFQPQRGAGSYLYRFDAPTEDMEGLNRSLVDKGVEFHTMIPSGKSTRVMVFDPSGDLATKVKAAADSYGGKLHVAEGRGEFLGSWTSREEGRAAYESKIEAYRSARGGGRDGFAWWDELRSSHPEQRAEAVHEGGVGWSLVLDYDPSQLRDEIGRWTDEGGAAAPEGTDGELQGLLDQYPDAMQGIGVADLPADVRGDALAYMREVAKDSTSMSSVRYWEDNQFGYSDIRDQEQREALDDYIGPHAGPMNAIMRGDREDGELDSDTDHYDEYADSEAYQEAYQSAFGDYMNEHLDVSEEEANVTADLREEIFQERVQERMDERRAEIEADPNQAELFGQEVMGSTVDEEALLRKHAEEWVRQDDAERQRLEDHAQEWGAPPSQVYHPTIEQEAMDRFTNDYQADIESKARDRIEQDASDYASEVASEGYSDWLDNNRSSSGEFYGDKIEAVKNLIDSRPPTSQDFIVHRGFSGTHLSNGESSINLREVGPGDVIDLVGFTSTSVAAHIADNFGRATRLDILVPKGSRDVLVTANGSEKEVIFNTGTALRVLHVGVEKEGNYGSYRTVITAVYDDRRGARSGNRARQRYRINFGRMDQQPVPVLPRRRRKAANFNPSQPRDPAGSATGGQWTDQNGQPLPSGRHEDVPGAHAVFHYMPGIVLRDLPEPARADARAYARQAETDAVLDEGNSEGYWLTHQYGGDQLAKDDPVGAEEVDGYIGPEAEGINAFMRGDDEALLPEWRRDQIRIQALDDLAHEKFKETIEAIKATPEGKAEFERRVEAHIRPHIEAGYVDEETARAGAERTIGLAMVKAALEEQAAPEAEAEIKRSLADRKKYFAPKAKRIERVVDNRPPTDEDFIVHRGQNSDRFANSKTSVGIRDLKPGDRIGLDGFTSASTSKSTGGTFGPNRVHVLVPKGSTGVFVTSNESEHEVIFGPKASLRVVATRERDARNGDPAHDIYAVYESPKKGLLGFLANARRIRVNFGRMDQDPVLLTKESVSPAVKVERAPVVATPEPVPARHEQSMVLDLARPVATGVPLHDVVQDGGYPPEFFGKDGLESFGAPEGMPGREAYGIVARSQGRPGDVLTVYRAIPWRSKKAIELGPWRPAPGDLVTVSKQRAHDYGKEVLDGAYAIVTAKVKAEDLYTDGTSIVNWTFDPRRTAQVTAQNYDPSEPREPAGSPTGGQWTDGGGGGSASGSDPFLQPEVRGLSNYLDIPKEDRAAFSGLHLRVRKMGTYGDMAERSMGTVGLYNPWENEIALAAERSTVDQAMTMAHELGHAFDHAMSNPKGPGSGDYWTRTHPEWRPADELSAALKRGGDAASAYKGMLTISYGGDPDVARMEIFADIYATQRAGAGYVRNGMFKAKEIAEIFPESTKVVLGLHPGPKAAVQSYVLDYDPNEPRDDHGRWTTTGGGVSAPAGEGHGGDSLDSPLAKKLTGGLAIPADDVALLKERGVTVRPMDPDNRRVDKQQYMIGAAGFYDSEMRELVVTPNRHSSEQANIMAHEVGHAFDNAVGGGEPGHMWSERDEWNPEAEVDAAIAREKDEQGGRYPFALAYKRMLIGAYGVQEEVRAEIFADLYATQRAGAKEIRHFRANVLRQMMPKSTKQVLALKGKGS